MKNLTEFMYRGIHFQYIEDCGLQILENGEPVGVESFEETKIRKEAEMLLEKEEVAEFDIIELSPETDHLNTVVELEEL